MKMILSFATEVAHSTTDFEITKRIADFLNDQSIVGNFHLTGDYARALKRGNRIDVIEALTKHEIGFHCNHHGGNPFMGGYIEDNNWDDGVAHWLRNELPGKVLVEELFDRPVTYYTTEFSKAPQVLFASYLAGIPMCGYLKVPFRGYSGAWFCNSFISSCEGAIGLEFLADEDVDAEDSAKLVFDTMRKSKSCNDDVIRVFTHLYRYYSPPPFDLGMSEIYKDNDWDYEDFNKDFPLLPSEKINEITGRFERTIIHYASQGTFLSFSENLERFIPNRGHWISLEQLDALSAELDQDIDAYIVGGNISISPAESFALLICALKNFSEYKKWDDRYFLRNIIGPKEEIPENFRSQQVSVSEFTGKLKEIDRFINKELALPTTFIFDDKTIGPGQFLKGLIQLYKAQRTGNELQTVDLSGTNYPVIAVEDFFQEKAFKHGNYYPDGFDGTSICAICRSQSWSWKPALKNN